MALYSPTMRTVSSATASWAWSVLAPMWWVQYTRGLVWRGPSYVPSAPAGSPSNTSSPANRFLRSMASSRASWSTTSARLALMKMPPGRIASKNASPSIPRVSGVRLTCTDTTSLRDASDSSESARPTPRAAATSGVSQRLKAITCMPNAWARWIIACPILPRPTSPRVRPYNPRDLPNSFLFQRPSRSCATLSGMRRSMASRSPNASSATARLFLPGQFETRMPRRLAASTSIVL